MDVFFESKDAIALELKTFTENHVKFSLKRLIWIVRKVKVRYSSVIQARTSCNQNCSIELQTIDHHLIEVSVTAKDQRTALKMGLKKAYKSVQKAFQKAQKYGRLPKYGYV